MNPVVFDCDGVLVDSEGLAWDAWRDVLGTHGIEVFDADVETLTGRSEADAYQYFSVRADLPELQRFSQELGAAIARRFAASLEAFEEVEDVLETLSNRAVPLAVASSSSRGRLALTLSSTGLDRFFQVVVAGDDVKEGKPAPDIFIEAARRLGHQPEDCIAVEDTAVGVEAAKRAGMFVVAVQRGGKPHLEGADRIVPALTVASVMIG